MTNVNSRYETYSENHCWQYDIRLKNLQRDIEECNIPENELNNLRVEDFTLLAVDKSYYPEIKKFIERHEWLGTMPMYPTHLFIAVYKEILCGAIVMCVPNVFSKILGEDTKNIERLIARGACISWSPKNLASALIMYSIRWMTKNTQFRVFSAYSDPEAKELGIIYQACNFLYIGQKSGAVKKFYIEDKDNWVSDRYFRQKTQYKKYARECCIEWKPEWNGKTGMKWNNVPDIIEQLLRYQSKLAQRNAPYRYVARKHKYIYILGENKKETKKLRKKFKELNPKLVDLPYPKER